MAAGEQGRGPRRHMGAAGAESEEIQAWLMQCCELTVPTLGSTGVPASTGATERMATLRARDTEAGPKAGVTGRREVILTFRGAAATAWTARLLLAAPETA